MLCEWRARIRPGITGHCRVIKVWWDDRHVTHWDTWHGVSISRDQASDCGSLVSLVKARDLTQHSRPCHILSPASLSPHSHSSADWLLLVISISSVQATPDLHRDSQDGPDTADHKLCCRMIKLLIIFRSQASARILHLYFQLRRFCLMFLWLKWHQQLINVELDLKILILLTYVIK